MAESALRNFLIPNRPGRLLIRVVLYVVAALGFIYVFQGRILYQPIVSSLKEVTRMANVQTLQVWPREPDYRGFLYESPDGAHRGTVAVFHGNAGDALDRIYYTQALSSRGFRVLLVEYPGYGARAGAPNEGVLVADAVETLRLIHAQFGDRLYVIGESLGAAVGSAAAAAAGVPIKGVAVITPWDTLPDLAQARFWYLPARWLVQDRFDNIGNLNKLGSKVAVCISSADEIIPFARGQRLFESLTTPKKRWVFQGSGHNDWPADPEDGWWSEVMEFLEE